MRPSAGTLFVVLSSLVVAAALAAGLTTVGSPHKARIRNLDEQRIDALRELNSAIDAYTAREGDAPASLEALAREQRGLRPIDLRDPETNAFYDYRIIGPDRYQLCAEFGAPSPPDEEVRWRHSDGPSCFGFTIDRPEDPGPPPVPAR